LDRWILAKVNLLAKSAKECVESFEIFKLMNHIRIFIDELSNWYVRRNRRRFWKSENDSDKIAAYDTLYQVLEKTIRILAPIIPFTTDAIYKNLVVTVNSDAPNSVHLKEFPKFDVLLHDEELLKEMNILLQVIGLGRSARNRANIKNRQPLSGISIFCDDEIKSILKRNEDQIIEELNIKKVTFVNHEGDLIEYDLKPNFKILGQKYGDKMAEIVAEINKNKVDYLPFVTSRKSIQLESNSLAGMILEPNDFILCENGVGDYAVATGNEFVVGIDTAISDELRNEGIVRDLVRYVQNLRKESGFNVEDRIVFGIETESEIAQALSDNKEYFLNEVLGTDVKISSINKMEFKSTISIDGKPAQIAISQVIGV